MIRSLGYVGKPSKGDRLPRASGAYENLAPERKQLLKPGGGLKSRFTSSACM